VNAQVNNSASASFDTAKDLVAIKVEADDLASLFIFLISESWGSEGSREKYGIGRGKYIYP